MNPLKAITAFMALLALIYLFAFLSAKADPILRGVRQRDEDGSYKRRDAGLPADPASYCKGFCQSRYQDGAYVLSRCACIDYYPMNHGSRIEVPHHSRPHHDPEVYNGLDEMHLAPSD